MLCGGCSSSPDASPELPSVLEGRSDAEVIAALRAKCSRLSSLSAVVSMAYSDAQRDGTFEAVFLYRAPRELRLQAYKDLIVENKQLFDLLFSPRGYALSHELDDDPLKAAGPLAEFPQAQRHFAGVFWASEALFLPGAADPQAPIRVLARRPDAIRVETHLFSGARAEWDLDPHTLRVTRGFVDVPPLRVQLEYGDYRGEGGLLDLPHEVSFREGDTRLRVQLQELDLSPEFVADAFRAP
jgi:hypothetical protein